MLYPALLQSNGCSVRAWCSPSPAQFPPSATPHNCHVKLMLAQGSTVPGTVVSADRWTAAMKPAVGTEATNDTSLKNPCVASLRPSPLPASVSSVSRRPRTVSDVSTAASFDAASDAAALVGNSIAVSAGASVQVAPLPESVDRYKIIAGSFSCQGRKLQLPGWPNQDVPLVVPLTPSCLLAAVFDGHGRDGHRSADRVRRIVEQNAEHLGHKAGEALLEAFQEMFHVVQEILVREGLAHYSGTTATVALIDGHAGKVHVAHVGDSTLAIIQGPAAVATTTDHRVDESAARRVHNHGGEVRVGRVGSTEVRRIYARASNLPGLAMARALGDQEAQLLGASCVPEFTMFPFDPARDTVVIASDGVWDVLNPSAAAARLAAFTVGGTAVREMACALVNEARELYPSQGDIDDITAVVIKAVALGVGAW